MPDPKPVTRRLTAVLFFVLSACCIFSLHAQEQPAAPPDSVEVKPQPFLSSEVSGALSETFDALTRTLDDHLSPEEMEENINMVDTLFAAVDTFLADTAFRHFTALGIRELDNIAAEANLYLKQLNEMQTRLGEVAENSRTNVEQLDMYTDRWILTLDGKEAVSFPDQRIERIRRIIQQTDSVKTIIQSDLSRLLVLQDRVSVKGNALDIQLKRIRDQKDTLSVRLFTRDMPGLFSQIHQFNDSLLIRKHIEQFRVNTSSDFRLFRAQFMGSMVFMAVLLLLFILLALYFKRNFAKLISVERFEMTELHMAVVYAPVVTAVYIMALLVRFFIPDLPHTFYALNLILLMISMSIIVVRMFGSLARVWMSGLVVLFFFSFLYDLLYYPGIWSRLFLLFLSLAALALFVYMIVRKPLIDRFKNNFLYQIYRLLLGASTILLLVAVAGNIFGAVRLAEYFALMPIQISILSLAIFLAIRVSDTIIYLLVASNSMQRLNVIRDEYKIIHKKTVRLVTILLWIFLFMTVLRILRLRDDFIEWGQQWMTEGFTIGEVAVTPRSIFIFVFVIWLSIFITRIIRHVLEKDVFTRVEVSRGMPSTIVLLLRIVLISGGFFLAAAAAGMELTNLSIVLGAFSVGIGFGLQNIFNNMVSGLILAFERPIKVGDMVEVGTLLGIVRSIGLRSSVVRTFDGAEVIVPNGNLISNEMVNWTRSDHVRRMDIRIGVAYGSDPDEVMEIIKAVAAEHEMVRTSPQPLVLFHDFGESSLDFRLLAWVHVDYKLSTESALRRELNLRLKDAKIEIPFPQRDLHIRSTVEQQGQGVGKKTAPKRPEDPKKPGAKDT